MDKNKIKSFAIWARRNLISAVSERANRIGVLEKKIEDAVAVQGGFKLEGKDEIFKLSKDHREKLVKEVREKGFQQVMEEVAYTWFNRFMGLRYMEVNDYLPSGIRVLSSEVEGKTEPDVLTRVSEVIDELKLNAEHIYALLDSGKTEDREEAYKYILVKQCNELGKIIPQMFEKISDYTELLLPDNLLEEGSAIRRMVEDIAEEDWKEEVEIIGWMYQYYISEKKDEVFAALKNNVKITKENIPAATQLFTPKWIVKYMIENSLGRLWLEGHPNEELQKEWKYYLEEVEQEPEVEEELKKIREEHSKLKPEDIKVLDPCMGSGHILVYAFDVLYEIYKSAGYSEREIPKMILQNNLYGLDIDDRAAQLASFALIMKARHYNRRLFREMERENLDLNLCSIQESNGIPKEAINYFVSDNKELRKDVEYLVEVFTDAKEYGSILEVKEINFEELKQRLNEIEQEENFAFGDYRKMILDKLPTIIKQAEVMSRKYEICVTNPPYMGNGGMNQKLQKYLKDKYPKSKSDMSTVFMECCIRYSKINGNMSMINIPVWMFISSYKELRKSLIDNLKMINMLHLGRGIFGSDFGTTTFCIKNTQLNSYNAKYLRLFDKSGEVERIDKKENRFFAVKDSEYYTIKQIEFDKLPSYIFVYWASENIIRLFTKEDNLGLYSMPKQGLITGDNDRYLRFWHEVSNEKFSINTELDKKWFPINKGGEFKKWYGNHQYIINWENNGAEIKNFKDSKGKLRSRPQNLDFNFKKAISWSLVTIGQFSARYYDDNFMFNVAGISCFPSEDKIHYLLGILNTNICEYFSKMINPTVNSNVGDIANIPIIIKSEFYEEITSLVKWCIVLSKKDWDSFENSWNFRVHPLIKLAYKSGQYSLSTIFRKWKTDCDEAFNKLKHNEEELNKMFIDIYGLQEELTPVVEDKDITIRKADRERDIKSFISYAFGCMIGRYSIDAEGLIYAGGEFKDKWNLEDKKVRKIQKDEEGNFISDSWVDATFLPDCDNVIPITEDEYFEDDIVSRFIEFVRTVYNTETLEENLDFIADSIGRKPSEASRQAIRRYFIKDFYKDHLKVYQKRPIYWMFESGKNDGFKALIYMHRYNEQTVAKVRTDYLHTLQRKYEAEIQRQQLILDSEEYTAKDRTAAKKKIDRISKQIEECREYDQVVAHLANEKISIDLDDGVNVNYGKFQGVKVINSKGKEVKMDLLAKI
jgi:hypothetical protein